MTFSIIIIIIISEITIHFLLVIYACNLVISQKRQQA